MIKKKCPACERIYPQEKPLCDDDGCELATILTSSLIGTKVGGKYVIDNELGRGGMGVVYLARHVLLGRMVAIKMLLRDTRDDAVASERFMIEAKAYATLNHPNIVRIYDFDVTEDGIPYIVMDYLEGKSLDTVLEEEGYIDVNRALPIFVRICSALEHVHRRKVTHRDLKPPNIMLVENDEGQEQPILLDFGIAKIFMPDEKPSLKLTQTGEVFGSPLYMSPEQCMGQTCDPRSDIYSLGCVIYHALTGKEPIRGDNALTTMWKHVNEMPVAMVEAVPGLVLPAQLDKIVMRALSKLPESRHQSMLELKNDLQSVLDSLVAEVVGSSHRPPDSTRSEELKEIDYYRQRAEQGSAEDQYDLAWYYRNGDLVEKAPEFAFRWFMEAAAQGMPQAQNVVADMYLDGEGTAKDEEQSFVWYLRSAKQGNALGQNNAARMYFDGIGTEQDYALAFYWSSEAAKQGNQYAMYRLAICYEEGKGVAQDEWKAMHWYIRASECGNMRACFDVMRLHKGGVGTSEDHDFALTTLKQAAEQGNPDTLEDLYLYYYEQKNSEEALKWLRLGAEQGIAQMQKWLGCDYLFGMDGVKADIAEALKWLRLASDQGHAGARTDLAWQLYEGDNVAHDFAAAAQLFKLASDQGEPGAIFGLGLCYSRGQGVPEDAERGQALIQEAAEAGYVAAMIELGHYRKDIGDLEGARRWWQRAAEQGSEVAQELLEDLDKPTQAGDAAADTGRRCTTYSAEEPTPGLKEQWGNNGRVVVYDSKGNVRYRVRKGDDLSMIMIDLLLEMNLDTARYIPMPAELDSKVAQMKEANPDIREWDDIEGQQLIIPAEIVSAVRQSQRRAGYR